jgi:glycosyltransferase involved in cell wall biosynthesis
VNISAEVAAADAGLVHDDTVAGTTAALRQWLALPAGEKQQMGIRGAKLFSEQFHFSSVAKNLLPVLAAS